MEIHELQQLLSEMSLQEKIGQMVQLTGVYFDKEAVLTGVVGEQIYGTASPSYSASFYGRCYPWMSDDFSDSVGAGVFISSGTGV